MTETSIIEELTLRTKVKEENGNSCNLGNVGHDFFLLYLSLTIVFMQINFLTVFWVNINQSKKPKHC